MNHPRDDYARIAETWHGVADWLGCNDSEASGIDWRYLQISRNVREYAVEIEVQA